MKKCYSTVKTDQLIFRFFAFFVFLGVVSSHSIVQAQNNSITSEQRHIQLQQFRPWADPEGVLQSASAANLGQWNFHVGLFLNWSKDPLVLRDKDGNRIPTREPIIGHQVGADLVAGIGLWKMLELSISVPMTIYQLGSVPNDRPDLFADTGKDLSGFAMGDIRIGLKSGFLQEKRHGVNLGLQAYLGVPSGSNDLLNGEGGLSFGVALLFNKHIGILNLVGNLGFRKYPDTRILGLDIGNELHYSVGAAISLAKNTFDILVDFTGATAFGEEMSLRSAPLEVLIGGRYYPLNNKDLALNLGVGIPFTPGYGTPQIRVLFGLVYAPKDHDMDKDGIQDAQDKCPKRPGPRANGGCPWGDKDGDGLKDNVDKCVDKPGPKENNGCPDTDRDGDGIVDRLDKCPDKKGVRELKGCPWGDADGDGLTDNIDKCKKTPGPKENKGCPWGDTDGDGLKDNVDKCPKRKGPKENKGCPDTDKDKDTVVDRKDLCPDVPGVAKVTNPKERLGCPKVVLVVKTKGSIKILKKIFFRTASSRIRRGISYKVLEQVAQVLKSNPEIKVRIEGHTDNRGGRKYNIGLSKARAKSVRRFLIKKGVAAERMTYEGFGPNKPIASNRTRKGRKKNRRVEFNIVGQ